MSPETFTYWLQGFVEIANTDWKPVSDLIGKEFEWNKDLKPPYVVTC